MIRARVAVRKAISTAIDRIATVDVVHAETLRSGMHTGLSCSYEPAPDDPVWILAWPGVPSETSLSA